MKIILNGVGSKNKGAELMFYAIVQEIERIYPAAEVYVPYKSFKEGRDYLKTRLNIKYIPYSKLISKTHLQQLFSRLGLHNILDRLSVIKNADWFIDGSGFIFSDQWNPSRYTVKRWRNTLSFLHKTGCRIVFLPQAFGPFMKTDSRAQLSLLNDYADIIMPREQVSYNYVKETGLVDIRKVKIFTDFTSLVEGIFPEKYGHLRNGICIIPNHQMIEKGKMTYEDYVSLLLEIIEEGALGGRPVYLLNHEGKQDEALCYKCQKSAKGEIEVVTGLNALEVKGMIASAYLVVTSRFHGLASSLNSCVPALATSWSHKYEELYRDYALDSAVIRINDAAVMLKDLMEENKNNEIRQHLSKQLPKIKDQSKQMWKEVWSVK